MPDGFNLSKVEVSVPTYSILPQIFHSKNALQSASYFTCIALYSLGVLPIIFLNCLLKLETVW